MQEFSVSGLSQQRNEDATSDDLGPRSGRVVDRDAEQYDPQHRHGRDAATRVDYGVAEQKERRNYEDSGNYGITRHPEGRLVSRLAAEDEDGRDRQGVERNYRGNESVSQLLERSQKN